MSQPWSELAILGSPVGHVERGQQLLEHEHAALEPFYAIWT